MNIFEELAQRKIWGLQFYGWDLSVTNGALTAFLAVIVIVLFFYGVNRQLQLIPTPVQSLAEYLVQFIREEMLAPLGKEGEAWLPFIVSLFSFILVCNLLGVIPTLLPPTSNINVTASLAILVFVVVQITGVVRRGPIGYITSLVPSGLPLVVAVLLFPIEVIGRLARPFSLAVRLFANMFAGHAIILTLIGLIFVFKSYLVVPFPVVGNVAIMAFEVFVSFIQAFIFTFLSTTYIIGALQTEH